MSTTLKSIVERLAIPLAGNNSPVNITLTGSPTTTTLISSSASPNKTSATAYNGVEALITGGSSGSAPDGESRIITSYNGTTTWTVTQAYTVSPASGDTVSFLYKLGYTALLDSVNTIVRNLPLPRWLPVTLCPDGDMEDSTSSETASVMGQVTDINADATLTKVTTAADTLLKRAVKIVGSADGSGGRWAAMNVHEGDTLFFSIAIRVDAGTAKIELYDYDASAVISGESYTTDEEGYVDVRFQYTVGTDVERIGVQITQDGGTNMTAFVGWISVLSSRQSVYTSTPPIHNVEALQYLPEGDQFENDSSRLFQYQLQPWPMGDAIRDLMGANPERLVMAVPRYEGPIFMKFRQTDTVLSAMADTVYLDGDELEAFLQGCEAEVFKRLADQARSQGNHVQEIQYTREKERRAAVFRTLNDSMGLAKPIIRTTGIRRVAV